MTQRREAGSSERVVSGFGRVPRLFVVAAGAGRDGTTTVARLIGELAAANG